jgi:hypothetical protein
MIAPTIFEPSFLCDSLAIIHFIFRCVTRSFIRKSILKNSVRAIFRFLTGFSARVAKIIMQASETKACAADRKFTNIKGRTIQII